MKSILNHQYANNPSGSTIQKSYFPLNVDDIPGARTKPLYITKKVDHYKESPIIPKDPLHGEPHNYHPTKRISNEIYQIHMTNANIHGNNNLYNSFESNAHKNFSDNIVSRNLGLGGGANLNGIQPKSSNNQISKSYDNPNRLRGGEQTQADDALDKFKKSYEYNLTNADEIRNQKYYNPYQNKETEGEKVHMGHQEQNYQHDQKNYKSYESQDPNLKNLNQNRNFLQHDGLLEKNSYSDDKKAAINQNNGRSHSPENTLSLVKKNDGYSQLKPYAMANNRNIFAIKNPGSFDSDLIKHQKYIDQNFGIVKRQQAFNIIAHEPIHRNYEVNQYNYQSSPGNIKKIIGNYYADNKPKITDNNNNNNNNLNMGSNEGITHDIKPQKQEISNNQNPENYYAGKFNRWGKVRDEQFYGSSIKPINENKTVDLPISTKGLRNLSDITLA